MTFSGLAAGPADVGNGATVYQAACVYCHGEEGTGGHGGGPTLANATSLGAFVQTVSEGRNAMPAFGAALSAEQIRDVSAYVTERLFGGRE
jgi:mono/diheme cytochrome c family protein